MECIYIDSEGKCLLDTSEKQEDGYCIIEEGRRDINICEDFEGDWICDECGGDLNNNECTCEDSPCECDGECKECTCDGK